MLALEVLALEVSVFHGVPVVENNTDIAESKFGAVAEGPQKWRQEIGGHAAAANQVSGHRNNLWRRSSLLVWVADISD